MITINLTLEEIEPARIRLDVNSVPGPCTELELQTKERLMEWLRKFDIEDTVSTILRDQRGTIGNN